MLSHESQLALEYWKASGERTYERLISLLQFVCDSNMTGTQHFDFCVAQLDKYKGVK